MNEQDMILKEKIEKREKFDTILAYILMVVLVGCIVLVLILKFTNKEDDAIIPDEYVPTYISLNEISNYFNNSEFVSEYVNAGARFNASVSGNSIVVSYIKDDVNFNLNMPIVGNELMITIDEDNKDIITDIYKEIGTIICVYYGNQERYCRNTLVTMGEDGNDGIKFNNTGNNSIVYIDTTKSYTVNTEILYDEVAIVDIDDTNYVLNMLDVKVHNITISTSEVDIKFSGSVDRTNDDTSNVGVVVKLYDDKGNILGENKHEYNNTNVLEDTGKYEIEFLFSDTLKLENIDKYSIEIVK